MLKISADCFRPMREGADSAIKEKFGQDFFADLSANRKQRSACRIVSSQPIVVFSFDDEHDLIKFACLDHLPFTFDYRKQQLTGKIIVEQWCSTVSH